MTDVLGPLLDFAARQRTFRDPIDWEDTLPIRPSSLAWRASVRAFYGTPLSAEELEIFLRLSGGRRPPPGGCTELLVVGGRRGGKSETIARVGCFEAAFGGHQRVLARGQRGLIPVISPLREQSQEILGYVRGLVRLPQVNGLLEKAPIGNSVLFGTGIEIRVMTADAIAVSGPTVVGVVRDEWAKWPGDESAMPDRAIEASLRPALAPVAGAPPRRIIGITSAYIQEGLAFETDRDKFGKADSGVLVLRGHTDVLNPNIDREWLAKEEAADPVVAAREYRCEWQPAIVEGYFPGAVVGACVDGGRRLSEPAGGTAYYAMIDAAFRGDLFALAVVHREQRPGMLPVTVVDGIWTWGAPKGKTLNVEDTTRECAEILHRYSAYVCADQFALDPLKEAFARHDIFLNEAPWTASTKPAKFASMRAAMSSGLVRLPEDTELVREFCNMRAKLLRSGGEQFEARAGHDDRCHAVVGAAWEALQKEPDTMEAVAEAQPEAGSAAWYEAQEEARIARLTEEWESRQNDADNSWILGPD